MGISFLYEPREDSFLLEKFVKKSAFGKVLDMGTGFGIQAVSAAQSKKVEKVVGVDVQKKVIDHCKKDIKDKKITFICSDLFTSLRREKFDTIIFNPPYLPEDKRVKDISLDGGKHGYEVVEKFLNHVSSYLNDNGKILLLFSSLSKKDKIEEFIGQNMLEYTLLGKKHVAFEDLYVYEIKKTELHKTLSSKNIRDIRYFSKGKRGYIFTGNLKGKKVAIKMNNPKSEAIGRMENEVNWLKRLNKKGIGPLLLFSGKGYFVYSFIEGIFIGKYLEKENKGKIKKVLKKVFEQMYTLDKIGVNKEEMHRPHKHVIIGDKPYLVDFERAHFTNKPGNVTQFCQYIISTRVFSLLRKKNININKEEVIVLAKRYKQTMRKKDFEKIIKIL